MPGADAHQVSPAAARAGLPCLPRMPGCAHASLKRGALHGYGWHLFHAFHAVLHPLTAPAALFSFTGKPMHSPG